MTWRALIVGDVHLRTDENTDDTVAALDFSAAVARELHVDAILFGGDIYEKGSTPHERTIFARVLRKISFAKVYGVRGNHDAHEDVALFDHLPGNTWLEEPAIVAAGPVDLLMVPWPERAFLAALGHTGEAGDRAGSAALAAMLRGMVAMRDRPEAPLILNAHLQVLGAMTSSAQPLIGGAIEAVLGDLLDLGLAGGFVSHVHRPQELAPGLYVPGSITVHDFGEEAEEKRIGILDVEDDGAASVEWLPVPCRRWVTVEAWPSGLPDPLTFEEVEPGTSWAEGFPGANVRYRYHCTEDEAHLFDHDALRRRFAAAHTLKIVPEIERTQRVRAAEVAAARTVADKLAAWGQATGTEITAAHLEKLHTLESEAAR